MEICRIIYYPLHQNRFIHPLRAEKMKKMVTMATDEDQEVIRENIASYPTLHSIISGDPRLYRVSFDQYKGRIPSERYDDVAEFSLAVFYYIHIRMRCSRNS